MDETIKTLLISLIPAISSCGAIIVAVLKLVSYFKSQLGTVASMKKDLVSVHRELQETNKLCRELLAENFRLKQEQRGIKEHGKEISKN